MTKTTDMTQLIAELHSACSAINDIADRLASENQTALTNTTITLEDVRTVLTAKTRLGHTAEVRELLKKHGADKLSEICPDEYPELLKEAKEIGT